MNSEVVDNLRLCLKARCETLMGTAMFEHLSDMFGLAERNKRKAVQAAILSSRGHKSKRNHSESRGYLTESKTLG